MNEAKIGDAVTPTTGDHKGIIGLISAVVPDDADGIIHVLFFGQTGDEPFKFMPDQLTSPEHII